MADDPKDRAVRDIPTGRLQRFLRMGRLSSAVSGSYVGQRIRGVFQSEETRSREMLETHLRNAARMAETMGHLKGAVMKVGQMISLGDEEILPPEATKILKVLQAQAPYLPYERIRARIEEELEGSIEELFSSFDPEPMAAASLGQVHRARLHDGMEVAVKVQYPDIDRTIHSDLANVKTMLTASGVFGRAYDLDPYFRELGEMLREEVDYVQEAVNLERMRALFADQRDLVIPRYVPERSTERVLTMELLRGDPLEVFLDGSPSREARDRAGWVIVDLILKGFLLHRTLHADPQAGNFLFQPDGRLALLDFGCIKRFDEPFVVDFSRALRAQLGHDREAVIDAYVDLGYIRRDAGPRTRKAFWELAEIYARPIARDRVYTFGSEPLARIGKEIAMRHPAVLNIHPPGHVVYLHRTLVGAYFVAARLGSSGNYHRRVAEIVSQVLD